MTDYILTSTLENLPTHEANFVLDTTGYQADLYLDFRPDRTSQLINDSGFITKAVDNLDNYMLTTSITTALALKQNTLISGTNIKTINGTSILGSGNLVIPTQNATWGNITGNMANQSDLNNALNAKVAANNPIVAGTKCKITYDGKGLVTGGADLTVSDIPSIPASKLSDINATATELNFVQGATSNIQEQIDAKPDHSDIKDGILTIQKNGTDLGTFSANQSSASTINIVVPVNTSSLVNDGEDSTSPYATQAYVESHGGKIDKIKRNNIELPITDKTVNISVPTAVSQLDNDSGFITKSVNNLDNYMLTSDINTALNNKVTKNQAITAGTGVKVSYDTKGLITGSSDLIESDIPNLHLNKITDVTATANEVNYLTGTTSNIQGQINTKLNITDVINNITTTTTNQALSANMGKELQDQINNLKQRGRYLSIWNCTTGLAETTPTVNPYNFKAGDYFLVGTVASQGGTNYRPNGATYDKDVPSTTVETGAVVVNDAYYYDGTSWTLLHTEQPTVAFSTLAGSPYDNTNLTTALNAKVTGNNAITGATKTKITYDSKGLVTAGTDLTASDIPNLTLNKITDVTASANEVNILYGATLTTTELNYVGGVTSSIQTQLDSKATPSDIKDGVLTIQKNGTNVATFSANQSSAQTANIIVPTAADDISYTNPDYPTVGAALDKLLYVMPSVSISGGGNYEIGATVNTVNLSWTWNKNISSQSLNQGIGSLATNVRSYSYTTPTTSNKTFTITGSDGTNTKSASTSITFYYKRYWGVSANTTLTDAEILALSQELSGNRAQTRTFNCSGGKYFYFVILASYCSGISFKVGGLSFSDVNVVTRNITNAQGHTASYNIYRPNNIQTGSAINVVVS